MGEKLLLNASFCAQCTVRPNKPKHQRKFYCKATQGKGMTRIQKNLTPQWFSGRSFYSQNLGWELQGVSFSWLAGGEVTGSGVMTPGEPSLLRAALPVKQSCLGFFPFGLTLAIYLGSLTLPELQRADWQSHPGREENQTERRSHPESTEGPWGRVPVSLQTIQSNTFKVFCRN